MPSNPLKRSFSFLFINASSPVSGNPCQYTGSTHHGKDVHWPVSKSIYIFLSVGYTTTCPSISWAQYGWKHRVLKVRLVLFTGGTPGKFFRKRVTCSKTHFILLATENRPFPGISAYESKWYIDHLEGYASTKHRLAISSVLQRSKKICRQL